jgi:glycosyltransferase involved in cell wall biosynthesis
MAAGMAIITSTAGGCPEVVGDAGVLVKPRDTVAIRDNLEKLVSSEKLRQQLAAAALERVQQFDWRNIASKFVELYEQTI